MIKDDAKKIFFINSPIISSIFFIFIDSIPFYFFKQHSINTQFGIIIIYCWICMNPDLIRPIFILGLGLLVDLFNNQLFGFTTLVVSIILFIQKKDLTNLQGRNFKITWIRFFIFIMIANIFSSIIFKSLNPDIIINVFDFFYSVTLLILIFPFIFYLVYVLNNKILYYVK